MLRRMKKMEEAGARMFAVAIDAAKRRQKTEARTSAVDVLQNWRDAEEKGQHLIWDAIKKAKANAGGESRAASATSWREAQATGRLLVHDAIERGRVEAKGRWLMNDAIERGRTLAHGSAALPHEPVREDAESLRRGPQPEAVALSKHESSTAEYLASRAV